MRLVFMGSPPFADAVLGRVLASRHQVAAVVTRPDRPQGRGRKTQPSSTAALAHARGVPVLQPETSRDPSFVAALRALNCELLLVASYGEILRRELLELTPRGAFNVHASLLPRHRGASPIQAAILCGDAETGVTIQRMVAALDEGDVLLREATPVSPDETASELLLRLSELGGRAAVRALDLLECGEAQLTPQDPALATYSKKITKERGVIDWSQPSAVIVRFVRAMTDWPGARATLADGTELVLLKVRALRESELGAGVAPPVRTSPGSILDVRDRLLVASGDGWIEVLSLKPSGKGAMSADAYLRGARLAPGARLRC